MRCLMALANQLKSFLRFKKLKNKKILLVDDNRHCLKFNSLILNKFDENLEISTASTGKNALELINNENFDFILLDLGLPDINGIDILKMMNIKKNDVRKVIVLTVYDEEYMKIACSKFKAHSFIEKPLDLDKLLNAIS